MVPYYSGAFETEDIPSDGTILGLHYSKPSARVLAHFEVEGREGFKVKRLFVRPAAGGKYVPVARPADDVSQDSVVMSTDAPLLFVNELRISPPGYDWFRLQLVNLGTDVQSTLLTPETIPREAGDLRAWILGLIQANRDGTGVTCIRAREEPRDVGCTQVVYEIVDLNIVEQSMTVISELKNILF